MKVDEAIVLKYIKGVLFRSLNDVFKETVQAVRLLYLIANLGVCSGRGNGIYLSIGITR